MVERQSSVRRAFSNAFRRSKGSTVPAPTTSCCNTNANDSFEDSPQRWNSLQRLRRSLSYRNNALKSPGPCGTVDLLDQTWDDWLEVYRQGSINLSNICRPVCFTGFSHMPPPLALDEDARQREVMKISDRRNWRQKDNFDARLPFLISPHGIRYLTVSTLDRDNQNVHYSVGLSRELRKISRSLSIDGHAVLSDEYFVLLDASSDWRMKHAPWVHGPPFIKFYLAVPLVTRSGRVVGCMAVFDEYIRTHIPAGLLEDMQNAAYWVMQQVEQPVNTEPSPRIDWPAAQSPAEEDSPGTETPMTVDEENGVPEFCLSHPKPGVAGHFQPLGGHVVLQQYQVSDTLLKCKSLKQAIVKACRMVSQSLGIEFVYVVEVRMRSTFKVARSDLDFPSGTLQDHLGRLDSMNLEPIKRNQLNTRLAGVFGGDRDSQFDSQLHSTALQSDFGLRYTSDDASSEYQCGLLMPFSKTPPTVTYRSQSAPSMCSSSNFSNSPISATTGGTTGGTESTQQYGSVSQTPEPFSFENTVASGAPNGGPNGDPLDEFCLNDDTLTTSALAAMKQRSLERSSTGACVDTKKGSDSATLPVSPTSMDEHTKLTIKWGGFVMCGCVPQPREFSPGDIAFMKKVVKSLENILVCHAERGLKT